MHGHWFGTRAHIDLQLFNFSGHFVTFFQPNKLVITRNVLCVILKLVSLTLVPPSHQILATPFHGT